MRLLLACLLLWSANAHSEDATNPASPRTLAADAPVREMATVVVTGVQPGPGMWKVSKGGHVMWVLGTQSPLPKNMTWRSDEVSLVLQQADAVLGSPGIYINADVGFLRGLTMLPSAMKAAKSPDGKKLQDVLPADLHAQWARLKQRYIGRDNGIEKKRPLIAAYQLYQAALSRSGMRENGVIEPVINGVLKKRKLKRTPTTLKLTIEDPRAALADFRKETLKAEDLACFRKTLDLIENDLGQVAARANAWATGDYQALRSAPREEQMLSCLSAWFNNETARKRGLTDIDRRVRARWLETAEAALQKNALTFATLPVSQLVRPDGYLADLEAKGYTVEPPE